MRTLASTRPRRPLTPVEAERQRRRSARREQVDRRVAQPIKTAIAVMLWLCTLPVYVAFVSPYISYGYATIVMAGTALTAGALLHLWPSKTAPWRTLLWAYLLMAFAGSTLLQLGAGTLALTASAILGVVFVGVRVNQNGRKLVGMIQDWRALR